MTSNPPPPLAAQMLPQVSSIPDEYSWPHRRNRSKGTSNLRLFHHDQPYRPLTSTPHTYTNLSLPPYFIPTSRSAPGSPTRSGFSRLPWLASKTRPGSLTMPWSSSAPFWLVLYFILNLTLTLYNKIVLIHFPFPYTLTALHALCGSIGTFLILHWNHQSTGAVTSILSTVRGHKERRPDGAQPTRRYHPLTASLDGVSSKSTVSASVPHLRGREVVVLLLFSVLYTINIVVSNASLRLVTVPFHQVVRASAPLFTILLSALLLGKYSSKAKVVSLMPVIVGVGFATYGDYYFTPRGFFLTLLGTLLAALKTILTNLLQKPVGAFQTPIHPPLSPPVAPFIFPPPNSKFPLHVYNTEKFEKAILDLPTRFDPTHEAKLYHDTYRESDSGDLQTEPLLRSFDPMSPSYSPYPSPYPALPPFCSQPPSPVTPSPNSFIRNNVTPKFAWSLKFNKFNFSVLSLDLPRLSLTPLQLLYLLSPLAFIQTTLLAHFSGELRRVNLHLGMVEEEYHQRNLEIAGITGNGGSESAWDWRGMGGSPRVWLFLNGVLAFLLNVVSFNANRRIGALAMSVSANVKQVLAVLCSVTLFNLTITPMNGLGIALTLFGGAWYAVVELKERKRRV